VKLSKGNPFESIFHEFVTDFGGRVLPEAPDGHTADYFFPEQNIIAELKSLSVDQTFTIEKKLIPEVERWEREHGQRLPGVVEGDKYFVAFVDMPRGIQDFWLKLLKASVENLIRDANKQIRDTKRRMKVPCAKGLLIIANEQNVYHNDPRSYSLLIGEILRKRISDGSLRYSQINAAVYFSVNKVRSRNEGMYFWAPLQMKQTPNEDVTPMAEFQRELQQGWYRYIERKWQVIVRQHPEPVTTGGKD